MNDMTNKATAVNGPRRMRQNKMVHKAARGLGWFSIGVGMAEILMPGTLARALNMQGREGLLQLYGLREIATGLGILNADDPVLVEVVAPLAQVPLIWFSLGWLVWFPFKWLGWLSLALVVGLFAYEALFWLCCRLVRCRIERGRL